MRAGAAGNDVGQPFSAPECSLDVVFSCPVDGAASSALADTVLVFILRSPKDQSENVLYLIALPAKIPEGEFGDAISALERIEGVEGGYDLRSVDTSRLIGPVRLAQTRIRRLLQKL